MTSKIKIILISLTVLIWFFYTSDIFSSYVIPWLSEIQGNSIQINATWDLVENINNLWFSILWVIKLILQWLLVIFIVYTWARMTWSMGADDEELSKSKRQIWYSVIAILFINMPWTLYSSFKQTDVSNVWSRVTNSDFLNKWEDSNMFFDVFTFGHTFWDQVIWFLSVMIFAIAVVIIIYQWLKIIISWAKEEVITEAKNKVIYSVLALVFVWIIEAFKNFAFSFKVWEVTNIFSELADLALFFAIPIAFFFLTIAAYYYITSAWDEERVKKAKSIVINTVLATLILLAAYTFLLDLANL